MHPLLRNPLTDYGRFVVNWLANRRRQPRLRQHYGALALESTFEPDVTLFEDAQLYRCHIGSHSYVGATTTMTRTRVGRFTSIGPGCRFGMGRHPTQHVSTSPMFYSPQRHTGTPFADRSYFDEYAPIEVGHDVWIGANVVVLDGVVIGSGAVVGAGAVVTRAVPPYAIVGGVPAEVIRFRFDEATIHELEASRWWELDMGWLRDHFQSFQDPTRFLAEIAALRDRTRTEPT